MSRVVQVGLVGDFRESFEPHAATGPALRDAAFALGLAVRFEWIPTESLAEAGREVLPRYDGLWCAPGSPYRSVAGALAAIRLARESKVPFLGTCGGCQHVILEFARNVLGMETAEHAEHRPDAGVPLVVTPLSCHIAGQTLDVRVEPGSRVAGIYQATPVREQYFCNFGLNPEYREPLEKAGLRVTGTDCGGQPRVFEICEHPFFVATLFVPQTNSSPERPHPLIRAYMRAAFAHSER